MKQLDNYLDSLIKLEEPRRTYLKLTSGAALDLVQNNLKEKNNEPSEKYMLVSMESTEEKKVNSNDSEEKKHDRKRKIAVINVLPPKISSKEKKSN